MDKRSVKANNKVVVDNLTSMLDKLIFKSGLSKQDAQTILSKLFVSHSPPEMTQQITPQTDSRISRGQPNNRTHEAFYITRPENNKPPNNTPLVISPINKKDGVTN